MKILAFDLGKDKTAWKRRYDWSGDWLIWRAHVFGGPTHTRNRNQDGTWRFAN
jgi:hypothetical protein